MSIRRPSIVSVATWLSNQGPSPVIRQSMPGSRTPASRAMARVAHAAGRDMAILIWRRSPLPSGLR